jgi:hypothetical protein
MIIFGLHWHIAYAEGGDWSYSKVKGCGLTDGNERGIFH